MNSLLDVDYITSRPPKGLRPDQLRFGAYLPINRYLSQLDAAERTPMISMCMRVLQRMVFGKEPRLSRTSDAKEDGGPGKLTGAAASSESKKFQQFYRTKLRRIGMDAFRMLMGIGLVPLHFAKNALSDIANGSVASSTSASASSASFDSSELPSPFAGILMSSSVIASPSAASTTATAESGGGGDGDGDDGGAPKKPKLKKATEMYIDAVVPTTMFAIWRYYDVDAFCMAYVLLRPDFESRDPQANWEVDPDGIVLSGFGYDPSSDNTAASKSLVATSLPLVANDARLEYNMMMAQDQLARPMILLADTLPAKSSSGIDTEVGQMAITHGVDNYQEYNIEKRMQNNRNLVDKLDIKVRRLYDQREKELRENLPLTSFLNPPHRLLNPGTRMPSSSADLPPGLNTATYPMPQTVAQFTEIRRQYQALVAANFNLPVTRMIPTEHRSVSGDHEGEQKIVDDTVHSNCEHMGRIYTVIYRQLMSATESRRLEKRLQRRGEWDQMDAEQVASRSKSVAPIVEFLHPSKANFEQTLALYETGAIDEGGYRVMVRDLFGVPVDLAVVGGPSVLKRERDMPLLPTPSAATPARSKPKAVDTGGGTKPKAKKAKT